jgi:hypothetical protein
MDDDDETVGAETPTTKIDFIEAEMTDLLLRYEIPYHNGNSDPTGFKQHVQLLIALTKAFNKSHLRVYDNSNQRVKSFDAPKWTNHKYYADHFTAHDDPSQRKTIIVHRVMSKQSIPTMKNNPSIIKVLKQTTTYLRAHFWKTDEVLLQDIGFLVSFVPTKHSKEHVAQKMFESCEAYHDVDWKQAPPFKLIHAQPKIRLAGKQQVLKTHAFSVQVLTKDSSNMNQFLRKIYEKEHLFVPYSMKQKFPVAVAKVILQQNRLIHDTWVIVLIGITREMMSSLDAIITRPGVVGILDTNRTDKSGRWHVLVTEKTFKSVCKVLTSKILTWVGNLPDEVLENIPSDFPDPKVYQKNEYVGDDDSSSGQASYMSSCAQSYGSYDNTIAEEQYY